VTAGEPVEVSATVSNPDEENVTETPAANETETANETEVANETESPTETATATEAAPNETEVPNATEAPSATAETQTVEFRVEGDVVATQNVTLEPGESTEVNFTLDTTAIEPGIYTHGVLTEDFGEMAVLRVVEDTGDATETPAPNATETPEPNGTESPGTSTPTDGTPTDGTPTDGTPTDGTPMGTDTAAEETETA
jgi:hypothetical protein